MLLETGDSLKAGTKKIAPSPFVIRLFLVPTFWVMRGGLVLVNNLLSLPMYLTRNTPASFSTYARRRGDTYIDSYARFKKNAQWTVGVTVVSIVAVIVAATSATYLRNKTASVTESKRIFHVGILKRATTLDPLIASFKRGLSELGYQDGERVIYDEQTSAGDETELEAVVKGFVDQKKDLILAVGDVAAQATQKATITINIPTVYYANFNPVDDGLIKSYARSDNNFVGIGEGSIVKQQIELLERIAPTMRKLGVMSVPTDGTNQRFIRALQEAAVGEEFTLHTETISTVEDITAALDALVAAGATAVYLAPSTLTAPRLEFVAQEVLARKMVLVGNSSKNAEAGALFALMADLDSVGQQLALQAEQIFRGTLPSQISSQFPVESSLAINLKTAAALGLTIPADIIERADVKY